MKDLTKLLVVIFVVAACLLLVKLWKDPQALNKSGKDKMWNGDYKGAEADFSLAIKNSEDPGLYRNRGRARLYQTNLIGAFSDFNRAIELNSDYAGTYLDRSDVELQLGKFQESLSDANKYFEQPTGQDGDRAKAYFIRGWALQNLQKFSEAVAAYDEGILLNAKYPHAFLVRGIAKKNSGNWSGAIDDFTKAIEADTNEALAYEARALAHKANGDLIGFTNDLKLFFQFNKTN